MLFLILILRAPAFWTPVLDVDETQFAVYANVLLDGGLPYVASVDTKPIGIYYFFAAVFALFGKGNMIAVHAATALVVALTAYYCFRIARSLYGERAGIFAALFYAVFTTTYVPKFISTSIVVIMVLPLTICLFHLVSYEEMRRRRDVFYAGLSFGVACLFKYQAGIVLMAAAFYFLIFKPLYLFRSLRRAEIASLAIFTAAGALVGGFFTLHLWSLSVWNDFMFWSFKGSVDYVSASHRVIDFPKNLLVRGGSFVASTLLVWYFGVRHSLRIVKGPETKAQEYLVLIWFIFNMVPVCAGGKFYGHYFIQILPPLVILASAGADRFIKWLTKGAVGTRHRIAYALFAAGLIIPAAGFFGARLVADKIYDLLGEDAPKSYVPIASYIEERSSPDDKIFVWGFATPVYYYSGRKPASRFLWCDWLTGRVSGTPSAKDLRFDTSSFVTPGSWEMFFADMEKNRPVYFVDTSAGNYHDYGKYPIGKYPQLTSYLEKYYELETNVARADIYRRIH